MRSSGRRRSCARFATRSSATRSARPTCSPARAAPGRPRSPGSSRRRSTASRGRRRRRARSATPAGRSLPGTSLDVIEMDAASQRGIDDVREIRERVILQPVEGRSKVYILDEAHQLTDAAFNALLKLIEEPPPHLVFIFCTTDVGKMLPTVRSRCQTFLFQRPRLAELTRLLRRVADGEGIDTPEAALALIARNARGSFRDAVSTLDQIASATDGKVTVPAVLELLGSVEEEALFRLCDLVVDHDTAGAAHVRRGAGRAGAGPGAARHRSARAPAPPPARAAHGRAARLAAGDRGDAGAAPRPRPTSSGACEVLRLIDLLGARRRRDPRGRRSAPPARARARQGHPAAGRPVARSRAAASRAARGPHAARRLSRPASAQRSLEPPPPTARRPAAARPRPRARGEPPTLEPRSSS